MGSQLLWCNSTRGKEEGLLRLAMKLGNAAFYGEQCVFFSFLLLYGFGSFV